MAFILCQGQDGIVSVAQQSKFLTKWKKKKSEWEKNISAIFSSENQTAF